MRKMLQRNRGVGGFFLLLFAVYSYTMDIQAQVTIGSDIVPNGGALLDLKQFLVSDGNSDGVSTSLKGLNLPRVALQDPSKLEPCAATSTTNNSAHIGLIVNNTTTNAVLSPGIYYWNGATWLRLISEVPKSQINLLNLSADFTTEPGNSAGVGGAAITFSNTITIPADGSYAFNIRFYGGIAGIINPNTRCVYYISIWADGVMVDIAEINIYANVGTGNRYTYSAALGASFTAGQTVSFKMSHLLQTPYPWTLVSGLTSTTAARTSMIWWQL